MADILQYRDLLFSAVTCSCNSSGGRGREETPGVFLLGWRRGNHLTAQTGWDLGDLIASLGGFQFSFSITPPPIEGAIVLTYLDCKEIKPANPKGNQLWIFTGRTDAEAPILWPPDPKSQLIGKDPDAGKDWGQEEKGTTEDGIVRWNHRLSGHEFEQTLGDNKGQGSLACCSPWGRKELDTERLNNNNLAFWDSMV